MFPDFDIFWLVKNILQFILLRLYYNSKSYAYPDDAFNKLRCRHTKLF